MIFLDNQTTTDLNSPRDDDFVEHLPQSYEFELGEDDCIQLQEIRQKALAKKRYHKLQKKKALQGRLSHEDGNEENAIDEQGSPLFQMTLLRQVFVCH